MQISPRRLFGTAFAIALLFLAIGVAWEGLRFGLSEQAAGRRLEAEVRANVDARTREVQSLARRVSQEGALIESANTERDQLSTLFSRLMALVADNGTERISATAYVAAGPRGTYRVLAWSEGPAEDLPPDRLAGPSALFVAQGFGGLRLVAVEPIEFDGKRVGVAVAETILAPAVHAASAAPLWQVTTSFGPVSATPAALLGGAGTVRLPTTFRIADASGAPLLDVWYSVDALTAERQAFRRRAVAMALLPLVCAALLATGPLLERRARSRAVGAFVGWSLAAGAILVAAALALQVLAARMAAPAAVDYLITALAAIGLVALLPGAWWWRRLARRDAARTPVMFVAEHLLAGLVAAGTLTLLTFVFRQRVVVPSLDRWQYPLFPIDANNLMSLASLILFQLALYWAVATLLAVVAGRWRVSWRRPGTALLAVALWLLPTVAVLVLRATADAVPWAGVLGVGASAAGFALFSASVRRYYRHTTQAMRLVLLFGALFLPTIVLYPIATFYADLTSRTLIDQDYAPATENYPQELRAQLEQVQRELDSIPELVALVSAPAPPARLVSSQKAFRVWSQTSLSRGRVTSSVELYDASRVLVSRFALNLPEYIYSTATTAWSGTGCTWGVFGEVKRFGAEDRNLLHAERALCDSTGRMLGAVVVHVAPDYRTLPFVSSANPYSDVLGLADATIGPRIADLQVVVYGWSLHPVFASGRVAWPIARDLADRLTRSRDPFWTTLPAGDRVYRVRFGSDRGRIYALGYPVSTMFEHATRLSEAAALTAAIFVAFLLGATAYAPFRRGRDLPLGALFREIRTSFYRKLFLFFVLAAVGPVLMLALAFGSYMTAKFRADVESEAASVVTVARRVFEELSAAAPQPDQSQGPSDDVMVWIGQVIGQDVNLFDGPRLVATSQRDLFDSGLLPVRTPAAAYRAIALNRAPAFVVPDRLGSFQYLVAAAPVPGRGRDAVLSVPLALRQREIEREIDELNRGVLVGAVVVVLFAAGLGASVAGRISDPVARLTRAARQIAAGRLDVRIVADTADELRRLVDDFNTMTETLAAQRAELARTQQIKAWAQMARQVAHEIKNPLTPIQLAAEHLQRVHEDARRPLGPVFDQCVTTILRQVRLLRQIAGEFSTFAAEPTARPASVAVADVVEEVVAPYRPGLGSKHRIDVDVPATLPPVWIDRTLVARALTNIVENALQAMPEGGTVRITAEAWNSRIAMDVSDTGVGMDAEAVRRAFEPYFSTKTAGSGLGLANAKRNVELCGGAMSIASAPGKGTIVTLTLPVAGPRGGPAGA
ncbi:MAG TPA: ATP-binding protein [Vicinamibacterales bacterium]|nr:ATP-binding protein [Vicinamibacterales bacterium]